MNGRRLSEAAEKFLRGRDRVTVDEIAQHGRNAEALDALVVSIACGGLELCFRTLTFA